MGKGTWLLITNILASVFHLTHLSEFPSFFDEDDLKSMGVKGHKPHYEGPTATGRYPVNIPDWYTVVKTDQGVKPPNGLPVLHMPLHMHSPGDFRNQNNEEEIEDDEDDSVFPEPDGMPNGGHDIEDLEQLPSRLSKTNKWAEFKGLIEAEGEQYKGKVMENWEDDAHMWAAYSRHLLERQDHAKQKVSARRERSQLTLGTPSIGLQQYWGEDTVLNPKPEVPLGPPPAEGDGFEGLGGPTGLGGGQGLGWPSGLGGGQGSGWPSGLGGGQGFVGSSGLGGGQGLGGPSGPGGGQGLGEPPGLRGGLGFGGPSGLGGGQGLGGPAGLRGGQSLRGPPGLDGRQGLGGPSGLRGSQGLGGPPGPGGSQGLGGPPGLGGAQSLGGPPGLGGGQVLGGPSGLGGGYGLGGGQGPGGPPGPGGGWGQGPGRGQGSGVDQGPSKNENLRNSPTPDWSQGEGPKGGGSQGGGPGTSMSQGLGGESGIRKSPPSGSNKTSRLPPGSNKGSRLPPDWEMSWNKGRSPRLRSARVSASLDPGAGESWADGGAQSQGGDWRSSKTPGLDASRRPSGGQGPGGRWGSGGPPGQSRSQSLEPGGGWGPGRSPGPQRMQLPSGHTGPGSWGQGGAKRPGQRRPPMMWKRRQMDDNDSPNDNLNWPVKHILPEKPTYKGKIPDMPGYRPGQQDQIPTGLDDSYLVPGHYKNEKLPEFYNLNSDKFSKLKPVLPMDKPDAVFDENMAEDQVPRGIAGRIPGPGSERDYPNGYRPNYGNNPKEMFHSMGNAGIGSKPPGVGQYSRDGYPAARGPFAEKLTGLRSGGGFPPKGSGGEDSDYYYPEDNQNAPLMEGSGQGIPGQGSEGAFPNGFHPSVAGGNMARGYPPASGNKYSAMQRGRPGWADADAPFPGKSKRPFRGQGGFPPGIPGGDRPRSQGDVNTSKQGGPPGWQPEGSFQGPGPLGEPGPEEGRGNYPHFPDGNPRGTPNPNLQVGPENGQTGFYARNKFIPTGYQLMQIAKRKLAAEGRMEALTAKPKPRTTTQHVPTKEEILSKLRQYDDFEAPIRWVPFTSKDTIDGLAQVTDKKTHKNQQIMIKGELYVPIVDESMSRLGWTTEMYSDSFTVAPVKIPNHNSAIEVVMRSMNLNNSNEQEWLAFETIIGPKTLYANECEGESCHSRCYNTACGSVCKGESCASGCVGVRCNSVCKSPGCFSMCIGEQCSATCEGMHCESRCWGKNCGATCKKFSCTYTANGVKPISNNATWDEMYPQYDNRYANPDSMRQGAAYDREPGPGPTGYDEY